MMSLSSDVKSAENRLECLKQQAIETCFLGHWSSLIHFMALSSVLQISVHSVYPDVSPAARALCHGLIMPREPTEKNDTMYIMFTRDGTLNNKKGTCFEPNHFCPLIPVHTLSYEPLQDRKCAFDENDFPPLMPQFPSTLANLSKDDSEAHSSYISCSPRKPRTKTFQSSKKLKRKRNADSSSDIFRSILSPKKTPASEIFHVKTKDYLCEKTGKYVIPYSKDIQLETPEQNNSKPLQLEDKLEARLIKTTTKGDEELLVTTATSFCTTRPYPLLPLKWYEDIGIESEIEVKASEDDKYNPSHKTQMPEEKVVIMLRYPLLPVEWYKKRGKEVENEENDDCASKPTYNQPNTTQFPFPLHKKKILEENVVTSLPYPLLSVAWYKKNGKEVDNERNENKGRASKSTHNHPGTTQFPFPLLKTDWYQRRGMLAAKNIAREKLNIKRKEIMYDNKKICIEYETFNGTLAEAKSNLRILISTEEDEKKKATLMATLRAAEYMERSGPIVLTQEIGNIFREEQQRILKTCEEKRPRPMSALIFSQLSRFLDIKQVYICGKAFIIENRNQNVNELVERLSNLTNPEKDVNDKIASAIGDIFKDSLAYVDSKKARDVLKGLFAQATSTKFVTKLQGIKNKTSIMNARDELGSKINEFKDIQKTSGVVRNDMTNEQQRRLTKRIIEYHKRKETKLSKQFDGRGRKLKVEEFPELPKILEKVFENGSADDKRGGGLESHPRLITTTLYRAPDNLTFMRQAREILLQSAPSNFTISLSSCYNYTENYRQNSHEAKRHHAGRNINANISLHRPPRDAVVDDKLVVNLHWSTCNVNYALDTAIGKENGYVVDSKDAKRIVLADNCPVQKPGRTWKKIHLPDHDWDQSRTNAITPMSHLFLEPCVTHKETIPLLLNESDMYITPVEDSSLILHITRTGRAVTLLNLSFFEPETTNRAFNEIFLLLTKPSLEFVFRNPVSGKLKENFIFVTDNGPSETPASPLVKLWLARMLKFLNLDSISQISFAEYHSKRNFVERVHAVENEVLSRDIFSSKSIHEKAEPGSKEHKENMEEMACRVEKCIKQAKFNGKFLQVFRGVADNVVFDDDERLQTFLTFSEEKKQECKWTYNPLQNDITETLSVVWNVDTQNFIGQYTNDYKLVNNELAQERTAWNDKYQTTLWRADHAWIGEQQLRKKLQPIPDYVRWLKTNELHYLTLERNSRITCAVQGRWNTVPGLFLPSRLLDMLFKINDHPPDDMFHDFSLLLWIQKNDIKRYFREANQQQLKSFEEDKLKEKWNGTSLYKGNSMAQLQEKCKHAGLPTKGLKHNLVQRLCDSGVESTPPTEYQSELECVPKSVKEIQDLATAQIKRLLRKHGFVIAGNRDELVLRLYLVGQGYHHLVFYHEQKEILSTINDAEQVILEERQDYILHPEDIYRKRTYSTQQVKPTETDSDQVDVSNLHRIFEKLKRYLTIQKEINKNKAMQFRKENKTGRSNDMAVTNLEAFFEIGTKVKVKWSADEIKGTGWKPGWYVAYVHSSDSFEDQIVVEHPTEPDQLYTLDVSPMVAEGSLKLG